MRDKIPESWPTGYVPLQKGSPYEPPATDFYGEAYTLNPVAGHFTTRKICRLLTPTPCASRGHGSRASRMP